MLKPNFLKQKLEQGLSVVGTLCTIPSGALCDVIASSGLDFMVIDCEHGPMSLETVQEMIIACESQGVSPIVRVPTLNATDISKSLDLGAHGIQVPNISSIEDANNVVKFSKFPPSGDRGFSPFTRAGGYAQENAQKMTGQANQNLLTVIHIEDAQAIKNIDEILKVKDIDIVFLGLFDISKSLGIPGQIRHPQVESLLKELTAKINSASKVAGTIATSQEHLEKLLDYQIRYVAYAVDCDVIRLTYRNIYAHHRKYQSMPR